MTAVWMFVALVAALAALGSVLAMRVIERGGPRPGADPYPTTRAVPLPFGSMVVERIDKLAEAAPPGTPGRWRPGSAAALARVEVSARIALSNETTRRVRVASRQFSLLVGRGRGSRRLPPSAAGADGTLPAGSILPVVVKFDAPRSSARLFLEFRPPGGSRPALVDLGTASTRSRLGAGVQVISPGHLHR